jgi:hypothetical protein
MARHVDPQFGTGIKARCAELPACAEAAGRPGKGFSDVPDRAHVPVCRFCVFAREIQQRVNPSRRPPNDETAPVVPAEGYKGFSIGLDRFELPGLDVASLALGRHPSRGSCFITVHDRIPDVQAVRDLLSSWWSVRTRSFTTRRTPDPRSHPRMWRRQ